MRTTISASLTLALAWMKSSSTKIPALYQAVLPLQCGPMRRCVLSKASPLRPMVTIYLQPTQGMPWIHGLILKQSHQPCAERSCQPQRPGSRPPLPSHGQRVRLQTALFTNRTVRLSRRPLWSRSGKKTPRSSNGQSTVHPPVLALRRGFMTLIQFRLRRWKTGRFTLKTVAHRS